MISDLRTKNAKLEKNNTTISEELKILKENFNLLMDINNIFGEKNDELKRKIEKDGNELHLSKKAKGKKKVIQISDDDDDDDDDFMDVKSNATDKLAEEPKEKEARVC
jgi:regulator of replication initiation timing